MAFNDLLAAAQTYFPTLQVKAKSQSSFMKLLGTLMFFNPSFMKDYITTIGNTIYTPTADYFQTQGVSGATVFMHELVHMHDEKKLGKLLYKLAYLFPQVLVPVALLLFLVSWKIALPLFLLFGSPLPAYFRAQFEKRAYISSLYTIQKMSKLLNFNPDLDSQVAFFTKQFKTGAYYWMYPFHNIDQEFEQAKLKVQAGERPYQDDVFDMLDVLVTKV